MGILVINGITYYDLLWISWMCMCIYIYIYMWLITGILLTKIPYDNYG